MPSFDIVNQIDFQEIDNAVNGVLRELTNRYDFKGAEFSLEIDKKDAKILINAEDDYKLGQIQGSLKSNIVKRGIDIKCLDFQKEERASGNSLRQIVKIKEGINQEIAKQIIKEIKNKKLKVQASIRGEEIRVEGKKIDELQNIMSELKSANYEVPLQFINMRS